MDSAGYLQTRIVSADSGWGDVVPEMSSNPEYAASVDVVGAHYPGQPPAAAYALNKTLFASEMWNLGEVDDWQGAVVLMSDLLNQASWGLSASILWCLIFSWYAPLPFSRVIPGTVAGAGHSVLTAAEPWSGHYELNPTIYAMAHHTQFASPGWVYLPTSTPGMSSLPGGGQLVTRFNPRTPEGVMEFSITLSTAGAKGPQDVTFSLPNPTGTPPSALHVWFTNETLSFVQLADVPFVAGTGYSLTLEAGSFYSLTTTLGQGRPSPSLPIPPSASFPFPYSDSFDGYLEGNYARYFCDEGGAFVAKRIPATFTLASGEPAGPGGGAFFQLVTKVPIVWETNPDPYTLIGDFNAGSQWSDYTATADLAIDPSAMPSSGPVGPGGKQMVAFQNTCSASAATQTLTQAASGSPIASAAFPGFCLGVTGETLYSGAVDIGLVACASAPGWTFSAPTRQLKMGNYCLDVLSQNTSVGARVIGFECKPPTPDKNQQWTMAPASGGGFSLQNALDSPPLCLDLEVGPQTPGGHLPCAFSFCIRFPLRARLSLAHLHPLTHTTTSTPPPPYTVRRHALHAHCKL
jgi:hypothetical protein